MTSVIDADGQRTKLTYPNSRYVTYTYDGNHHLDQVKDESNNVLADYDYKGLYLQDRKLNADALRLTFKDTNDLDGYDAFGRIAWMRHYRFSNGTDVVKLTYGHDYVSSPKYEEDLVNANMDQLYGYDALHRLTSFKRGNLNDNKDQITDNPPLREQSWTLQHVGNWSAVVSKTGGNDDTPYDARTHNTVNEITAIDPQGQVGQFSVVSDDAGNLKELPDRTDTTKAERYTYDYRNRLVKVEHSNNYNDTPPTWSTVVEYYYDGLNRRVKKDLPGEGVDVIFLYDGWRCIEERELDGQTWEARRQFVFGGLYLDEELLFDKDTDADGVCDDARYLYCQNNNFNVMALSDSGGAVKERYKYDPYGGCTVTLDDSSGNPFRFQGQRYDSETGLYYFKNRYYSPVLGRFLQRDPGPGGPIRVGAAEPTANRRFIPRDPTGQYVDGMNLYEVEKGSPSRWCDPMGTNTCSTQPPGVDTCVVYWTFPGLYHAFFRIGNWTMGYGGHGPGGKKGGRTYEEDSDPSSWYCHPATRKEEGSLPDGTTCCCATPKQIQDCVKEHQKYGADTTYNIVGNNCGNWVQKVSDICCLKAKLNASRRGWWIWEVIYPGSFEIPPEPPQFPADYVNVSGPGSPVQVYVDPWLFGD